MPRLLTYNVHRCVGTDKRLDVARIVGVIAEHEPDIVCLQELDVGRARTGNVDQAEAIAAGLDMSFHFNAAMLIEAEEYGDALLTRRPERLIRKGALPTMRGIPGLEPRGAVWAAIDFDGVELNVINTHLGLVPQRAEASGGGPDGQGLDRPSRLRRPDHPDRRLQRHLDHPSLPDPVPGPDRLPAPAGPEADGEDLPSAFPAIRIDHAFVSPHIRITGVKAPFSPLARVASDHLPLVIDFEIVPVAGNRLVLTVAQSAEIPARQSL
jgi:endonuclease/exonuclease/phosphatase family metal-dependent hydrolase